MFKKRKRVPDYDEIHELEDELGFTHLEPDTPKTSTRADFIKKASGVAATVVVAPPVIEALKSPDPAPLPAPAAPPFEESYEMRPGAKWVMASATSSAYFWNANDMKRMMEQEAMYGGPKLRVVKGYR